MIFDNEYPNHDSQEHWEKHQQLRKRKGYKYNWEKREERFVAGCSDNLYCISDELLFLEAREILAKEKKERIALRLLQKKLEKNASFGTYREWIAIGIIAIAIIVII